MENPDKYDVLIVGAGMAGLALARQLLLTSDKRILLIDRRAEIPPKKQKVGEATVQVSGYYLSKVLELEEHLLSEHFMKYNLRFYWNTPGQAGDRYEHYSQSYIRNLSNIATYQLDRNVLERELLRLNSANPRFRFCGGISKLDVSLNEKNAHTFRFAQSGAEMSGAAEWVVDTSGRSQFLARAMDLRLTSPIRHGASWLWVDGLLDIEKLTALSAREIRLRKDRTALGHLPVFLATNHFMGEGFWLWVIPLHGKTSIGLVFDTAVLSPDLVDTPQKLVQWICSRFPLFSRDLPGRTIGDHGCFRDFSFDCGQTISASRWALAGEAGRFTDPLYSPGGDLISIHNSLIADAIVTNGSAELSLKAKLYEQLMRACYSAYVPSYAVSYDCLGDQEAYSMKYTWELTIYFAFYVFPFINDLFTDIGFLPKFLERFLRLKPLNSSMQSFLSSYFQWKKSCPGAPSGPVFHDFTSLGPLRGAESTFYKVGLSAREAVRVIDDQLEGITELYRYFVAHIASVVLDDRDVLFNREFIAAIPLTGLVFDPEDMKAKYERARRTQAGAEPYRWSFESCVMDHFLQESKIDACHA
jgi:flavin-dependent dehydrogenase